MSKDAFIYKEFEVDSDRRTVRFNYRLCHGTERYDFTETLEFPLALPDRGAVDASLRALHLALGISYYKIFLPGSIEHSYKMGAPEADFWNGVWHSGLGEFLYVNKLSPDKLAKFTEQTGTSFPLSQDSVANNPPALLGIGGGKDSIVARELLRDCDIPVEGFVMATGEQIGQAGAVADKMGLTLHVVKRELDRQLLVVQQQPGAYRGHIPISLVFGLVGTALAAAKGTKYVIVANEASASIPQITWGEIAVNHQWSKSLEFEKALQGYVQNNISSQITYFSAIRQLTSIGVAKLFASYLQYFEVFTSDNAVFRIDQQQRPAGRWSLESPKSLSSFILLAPWVAETDMIRIFGLNLLGESSLEHLFLRLTGVEGEPPLDCVGTVKELVLSLNLLMQQAKFTDSHLCNLAREKGLIAEKDWQAELKESLMLQPDHMLPPELSDKLSSALQEELQR
jgi:hypothetical protein